MQIVCHFLSRFKIHGVLKTKYFFLQSLFCCLSNDIALLTSVNTVDIKIKGKRLLSLAIFYVYYLRLPLFGSEL